MTERLYSGKRQLEKALLPLVDEAAVTLGLSETQRQQTIIRIVMECF